MVRVSAQPSLAREAFVSPAPLLVGESQTETTTPAWYDPGYSYRRAVTVDALSVPSNLTQYQVKITLTAPFWDFYRTLSDGSDIRVTAADGVTLIPYYVLSYNQSTQTGTIWVRVPSIPAGTVQTLYLYYGNASPATFTLPPTGLFTRPTTSVHTGLGENMVYDATSNAYYVVYCTLTDGGTINLSKATTPAGPWTDQGVILPIGTGWELGGVYAPHLVQDAASGTWYLFYTGEPDTSSGNSHSIGVATASSITGTYTRSVSNPVVAYGNTAGTFDRYRATEPFVYYSTILSKWVMLYMGDAGAGAIQIETVGYATADTPGGPWTKAAANPIIALSPTPAWDSGTVADPWAVEIGGVTYIGYTGSATATVPWQIGFVTTTDFMTFTRGWQVYSHGVIGEWDAQSAFRGGMIKSNNTWYLSYTGLLSASTWAWGVASMGAVSTATGFDPWQVFDYYDGFAGSSVDANKWASPGTQGNAGTATVSGGTLHLASSTASINTLQGRREFGIGYVAEFYCRSNNADGGGNHAGEVGLIDISTSRTNAVRLFDNNVSTWIANTTASSSGTNLNMAQTIDGTYHTRRIAWVSPTSVLYQIDNNPWQQITTNIPVISLNPWLFVYAAAGTTSMDVQSVIVRRYSAIEPLVTVGSETASFAGS